VGKSQTERGRCTSSMGSKKVPWHKERKSRKTLEKKKKNVKKGKIHPPGHAGTGETTLSGTKESKKKMKDCWGEERMAVVVRKPKGTGWKRPKRGKGSVNPQQKNETRT